MEQTEGAGAAAKVYTTYRSLLFALAYRMLGSVMDAEDIVQEAFLAMSEMKVEDVRHPKAYLCKIVTNRCIDRLRSASKQREVYVGPWLPEPLVETSHSVVDEPFSSYMQKESLSTAYLLLLQQLSWVERAVFLLREVLQYEYDEIAEIVGKSSTNCRQIFRRAKLAISGIPEDERELAGVNVQQKETTLVEQFVQALASGNMPQLLSIVKEGAVLYSDGGGKVRAAVRPIVGADRIAAFFFGLQEKQLPEGNSFAFAPVNGATGVIGYAYGQPYFVLTVEIREEQIASLYLVVNPDKLKHVVPINS
ncbi:RNA polymerase sigma-70 factor [Paenibacillus sp. OV219]|uniref:RNA polymerase sigma-70 factor n=1 Tax=Paenibacillus sp. OV219 TaxID=1884377 RepID=UPI0008C33645|nr:RNA polymerase sigma-70 factor [Paenibacillus sp. OV219]SEM51271.1 RNA polymerase sigma-70 factor, ECF subfamily [Paenibacillus sp. OV219]